MDETKLDNDQLLEVLWKPCCLEDQQYIIKYVFRPASYCIILSDLVYLYSEEVVDTAIMQRCKELNPKIEIELSGVLRELHGILLRWVENVIPAGEKITILSQNSQCLKLKSESLLADISFLWQFNMGAQDSSILFSHILQPMFGIACELKKQNHELIKIIKKKDAEIEDYKDNGAKCSFKHLETQIFKEEDFIQNVGNTPCVLESLKKPIETVFSGSLYSSVSAAIQDLTKKQDVEEAVVAKKCKSAENESEILCQSSVKQECVEHNQDLLVHRRLEVRVKRKPKKKPLNL